MMKTLYATSLYLLITCLRVTSGSVNGLDSPPLIKLQNEAFKTCITFHDTSSPSLLPSAAFLGDCANGEEIQCDTSGGNGPIISRGECLQTTPDGKVMVSGCADPNSFNNDNVNQLFSFINHSQIFGDISAVQGGRLRIAAPDAATLKALPCANSDVRQIFNAVPV